MSIRIEDFLQEYFDMYRLQDALRSIGITPNKIKEECIEQLLVNWTARNRSWIQILEFLDYEELMAICDHFNIGYYEGVEHPEDLIEKIEKERIIDFHNKTKPLPTSKKTLDSHPHKIQKRYFVIGIVAAIILAGIGMWWTYYVETFPTPSQESKITEQSLAKLLKEGNVDEFNSIKANWTGQLNFDGIKLSDMNLTRINLNHASLRDAQFDGAILTQAHFNGAILESANFRSATLDRADFVDSNLQKAFLRNSDLELANLNRAEMQNANLYAANLKYASLIEAQLQNANLGYSEFNFADLRDANIEGAILNNTDFLSVKNLPISNEEAKERGAEVD